VEICNLSETAEMLIISLILGNIGIRRFVKIKASKQ
jgi:hypothetical protein